jgi:hypothetical protein
MSMAPPKPASSYLFLSLLGDGWLLVRNIERVLIPCLVLSKMIAASPIVVMSSTPEASLKLALKPTGQR